ncbi:MAG: hypothetical protein NVS3B21_36770 [Acidimicrobiales bacterium]
MTTGDRPRPLVAGNWKMNGRKSSARVLDELREGYTAELKGKVDLLICPPATLIHAFALSALGSRIAIGGQDSHAEPSGAFTGDISAEMLALERPRRSGRRARRCPSSRSSCAARFLQALPAPTR